LVLMGCKDSGNQEKHKSTISIDFDEKDNRNEYDLETKKTKYEERTVQFTTGLIVCDMNSYRQKPDTIGTRYNYSKLRGGNTPVASDEPEPYAVVDEMPEFYGGINGLSDYFKKNLKYPEWERKNKIEGTVYVTFLVNSDGKVKYPQILESVEGAKNFDEEVKRVINKMPLWKPGKLRNVKVNVQYNLPIKFTL
jgi:TonB family protein